MFRPMRVQRLLLPVVVVFSTACFDTTLPTPIVLGPGTVRATLVTAAPNRADLVPAKGATVRLVGTTLDARADDDGNIVLAAISTRRGRLIFELDVDGDGSVDRSRTLSLEDVGAGFGKDVNVGQLVLGRSASIVGSARRADVRTPNTGHGGIAVFLPQLPALTFTGDDGSYVLAGVPEGTLVVTALATGYRPESTSVEANPSEELRLAPFVLQPVPSGPTSLTGRVESLTGEPLSDVTVRSASNGNERVAVTGVDGRFLFEGLPTAVYTLGLSRVDLRSLIVSSVGVSVGNNDVGVLVMTPGAGRALSLDGGPSAPDAGGTGGGSAGGSSGGGVAGGAAAGGAGGGDAGGAAGGASTAGGAAGGSSGGTAGGNAAGGSTAGGSSGGTAGGSAGGNAAGGSTAGGSSGGTAGGSAAGGSAGGAVLPVAIVGPAQVVGPGALVRLDGARSVGGFPLRYRWTQQRGPTVTLSDNDSLSADDPTFTAPSTPTLLEFRLTVTEQSTGLSSTNAAVAVVSVSSVPVARFVPDGGLVAGGQTIVLQSTSFDDGGLPLVQHEWTPSGFIQSVASDAGTAWVTFQPLAFMAMDELGTIELRVTNSVGARSAPFTRTFQIRGSNPNNWSIDAGPNQSIAVGASPPTVSFNGSVAPASAMPAAVSWSCMPPLPLANATSLSPQVVAPVVVGASRAFVCSMTAMGLPPLSPAMLSSSTNVTFFDTAPPTFVSVSAPGPRLSHFGWTVRFSEPIQSQFGSPINVGSCSSGGNGLRMMPVVGTNGAVVAPRDWVGAGSSCPAMTSNVADFATPSRNVASSLPVSNAGVVQPEWVGPWVSTADYADPRPVIATMGPLPTEEFARWNPPQPLQSPFELVAREGTSLLRTTGFDPLVADAGCSPTCDLSFQAQALTGLTPGGAPFEGTRAFFNRGSLFVVMESSRDGGMGGIIVTERNAAGTWQPAFPLDGVPFQVRDSFRQMRVDAGVVFLDNYVNGSFVQYEQVVDAGEVSAGGLSPSDVDYVALAVGPTRTLRSYARSAPFTWSPPGIGFTVNDVVRLSGQSVPSVNCASCNDEDPFVVIERATSPQLVYARIDRFGTSLTLASTGLQGWSMAVRGGISLIAASINGDVRLLIAYNRSGFSAFDFNGPPRAGFPTPPPPLDVDVFCEAAWPQLAFIEDALAITWQERCAPQTRWRIVTRVIR